MSLSLAIDVRRITRPKGRAPVWAFRVSDGSAVTFDSSSVSLRLSSHAAAARLGCLVSKLPSTTAIGLAWIGDLKDDCWATCGPHHAHVEHQQGPKRGGVWYWSVGHEDGSVVFHSSDHPDIQPKDGRAARWLCELIIRSAVAGILGDCLK